MRTWFVGVVVSGVAALAVGVGLPQDAQAQNVKKPSQIYLFWAQVAPSGSADLIGPSGPFSVPEKKVLVIRSINIFPISPGPGLLQIGIEQGAASVTNWNVPMDGPTFIPYPAGFKLLGGSPRILHIISSPGSDGSAKVEVNAILYPDK